MMGLKSVGLIEGSTFAVVVMRRRTEGAIMEFELGKVNLSPLT